MKPEEFSYSFSVWPDETWIFDKAVFALFRIMSTRIEMEFDALSFETFRSGLSHHGIILREITRVPSVEAESVL